MRTIKFNRPYCKLQRQKTAKLLYFDIVMAKNIHEVIITLDASYIDKETQRIMVDRSWYDPKERYIRCVFLGDYGVPFITFRKFNPENISKYYDGVGMKYRIVIEGVRHGA